MANQNTNKYKKADAKNPFGSSAAAKLLACKRGTAEHDVKCMELRSKGYTYQVIANTLGIGKETARMGVERQLQRLATELRFHAANVRELEDIRLDDMIVKNAEMSEAVFNDYNMDMEKKVMLMVRLHDSNIRIMERRAKMFGLDAPVKTENKNANVPLSYAEMMSKLDQHSPNQPPTIDVQFNHQTDVEADPPTDNYDNER